jgi:hypothetical protein
MSEHLQKQGFWELQDIDDLLASVNSAVPLRMPTRGTFLDVGAHIGTYTLQFARRGYSVIAVEPMLQNTLTLNASLCINPPLAENVTIVQTAIVGAEQQGQLCTVGTSRVDLSTGRLSCVKERPPKGCHSGHQSQLHGYLYMPPPCLDAAWMPTL